MNCRSPEYQRMMYQKHREKRLAAKKAERDADPEAGRAYQRAMYAKHREKRVAEARAKRAANQERLAAEAKARYYAGGEELKARRRELAKTPDRRAKQYAHQRRWLERNPDRAQVHYAKNLLAEQTGIPARDIPDDIAEAKVEQLKISRWVKEQLDASCDTQPKAGDDFTAPLGSGAVKGVITDDALETPNSNHSTPPPEILG